MGLRLAGEQPPTAALPAAAEQAEDRIGRYKLLEKIGEGGCGVVYMAEQSEPVRRRVALKVIKLGMDTHQVVARFEAERQALALMDHPNIAKVLDGGATETGRPYFVMELVKGIKITDYCDQNNLSPPERLKLFIHVCQAIQHAHQKGIIHRDIKPSNILVTLHDGAPVPKVIDFGIAKATEQPLTDKTLFTAFNQFIGTPAYMSPEQAELTGLDIDTRSDIYSLGVLLYELLTGTTPFDTRELMQSGLDELRKIIREREPARPSTRLRQTSAAVPRSRLPMIHSQLSNDLDWIVMKCLEKDRTRRYETANGLAMDVERHLTHEPILARPPDKLYRLGKLVRRNKFTFAAGLAGAVTLVVGPAVAVWLYLQERQANQRAADADAQRVRQAALEDEKAKRDVSESERHATLARVRANWLFNAQKGRIKEATADLAKAIELNPAEALCWFTLAPLLLENGDEPGYFNHRVAMLARFGATNDPATATQTALAALLSPVPGVESAQALELADEALSRAPDSLQAVLAKGLAEYRQGRFAEALEFERRVQGQAAHDNPTVVTSGCILAMAHHQLGHAAESRGVLSQADELAQKSRWLSEVAHLPEEDWFGALTARVLLREAHHLIGAPASASPESQAR
jgi:tetratricopeptide (TPR) repeat protein